MCQQCDASASCPMARHWPLNIFTVSSGFLFSECCSAAPHSLQFMLHNCVKWRKLSRGHTMKWRLLKKSQAICDFLPRLGSAFSPMLGSTRVNSTLQSLSMVYIITTRPSSSHTASKILCCVCRAPMCRTSIPAIEIYCCTAHCTATVLLLFCTEFVWVRDWLLMML